MSDADPTPREDAVRRLLAEARHDGPIPDDVAARLDAALADLRSEAPPRAVGDLAAARRRRARVRTGLVAAAAVVLVGVGISRVDLSGESADAGAGGSADSSATREEAAGEAAAPDALSSGSALADLESLPEDPRLRSDRLEQQVARLVAQGQGGTDGAQATAPSASCPVPPGPGRAIYATYDGDPAVLVIRPPADGMRVAEVYLCGASTPARSVTVPVG